MKTPITQDYDRILGMTFGQMLDILAREESQKEIFVYKNRRITYQAFHQQVRQMAKALKNLGIKKGDRVERGSRFGMIRFGSRVDVYLPPHTQIQARLGQKAYGPKPS